MYTIRHNMRDIHIFNSAHFPTKQRKSSYSEIYYKILQENCTNLFPYPSHSPNLLSIEHLWYTIGRR